MTEQHTCKNLTTLAAYVKLQEEKLRGRPGYEHLNEPLHILIEADLPANVVDIRLRQAQDIIEELLKPVVRATPDLRISFKKSKTTQNFLIKYDY